MVLEKSKSVFFHDFHQNPPISQPSLNIGGKNKTLFKSSYLHLHITICEINKLIISRNLKIYFLMFLHGALH